MSTLYIYPAVFDPNENGGFTAPSLTCQAKTAPIRDELQNRAVKKTLTIPQWLNDEAEAAGLNFSQTLQYALKEKLGFPHRTN